MLKKIPGTASLYISEEGKLIDETGACAPLVDNCSNVTITMYNHLVTKPAQWVVNMADLEIIKHPWLDSVYFDITFIKPRGENQAVQAYDLTTDTIHNAESIRQLAKQLGMDYSKVHGALNSPSSHRRGNFIFRLTTDQPWNVKEEAFKCSPMRILATSNSDSLIFDSIRDAAAHFKCSRGAIKCRLENDKLLNGYQFSRVDGTVSTPSE